MQPNQCTVIPIITGQPPPAVLLPTGGVVSDVDSQIVSAPAVIAIRHTCPIDTYNSGTDHLRNVRTLLTSLSDMCR